MQINANEIESIEDAGELNMAPVKMIRTKGGLWIAVGTPLGKIREEALAAGSHPAIVKYNIEKKYPGFQPSLQKSENIGGNTKVMQHSHFLPENLRKSGCDIHSLDSLTGIEFIVSQHGITKGSVKALVKNNVLEIVSIEGAGDKSIATAIMSAIAEKSLTEKYTAISTKGLVK